MIYQMLTGATPYQSLSDYDLYESIKTQSVSFPDDFDPVSKDLILKLLDKNPATRLGCDTEDTYNILT